MVDGRDQPAAKHSGPGAATIRALGRRRARGREHRGLDGRHVPAHSFLQLCRSGRWVLGAALPPRYRRDRGHRPARVVLPPLVADRLLRGGRRVPARPLRRGVAHQRRGAWDTYTWPSMSFPTPSDYRFAGGNGLARLAGVAGFTTRMGAADCTSGPSSLEVATVNAWDMGALGGATLRGDLTHAHGGRRSEHGRRVDLPLVELDDWARARVARPGPVGHRGAVCRSSVVRTHRPRDRRPDRGGRVAGRAVRRDLVVVRPLVPLAFDAEPVGPEHRSP